MVPISYIHSSERASEKHESRLADIRDLRSGHVTADELRDENAAFAFPPDRVELLLDQAGALH